MSESNEHHKQNSKNFEFFRQLSYVDILNKLDTENKIEKSFYNKVLNLKTIQQLATDENPSNDTLTSFVFNQLKFNLDYVMNKIGIVNFRDIIEHNEQQASNTPYECALKQEKLGNEKSIITILIYVLLFHYFKEFDIKGFIPILVNIETSKVINELTKKAIAYSKLHYCMYGNYLPIVYCIFLSKKCPHVISYLCLPSEDNQNQHQFNGIVIDTAGLVTFQDENTDDFVKYCVDDFTEIISDIKDGFKSFLNLEHEKISLNQIENKCIVNLQDKYGICANYSLGIVLNYLFQQDHLASKVLNVCDSLKQKGTDILEKILITIGNVSNLFHKFLRYTVFEHIEHELFIDAYNLYVDNISVEKNLTLKKTLKKNSKITNKKYLDAKKNILDTEKKFNMIPQLIIKLLKNPDESLWKISKFLKECNEVVRLWYLKNLEMSDDDTLLI